MKKKDRPIGFFDSGVGGISVLKEAVRILPKENYIYYGDSINAPYGVKSVEDITNLTFKAVRFLLSKEVKAIVVACNTATSAAIDKLRQVYNIPIIGIEPALKPAVKFKRNGKIIIMATPRTLSERKFYNLMKSYEAKVEIQCIKCPGLVELIEDGIIEGEKIKNYLKKKLDKFLSKEIAAIVLGCTHYPFIRKELHSLIKGVPIIDGAYGTAKQLKNQLESCNVINDDNDKGYIQIYNSLKDKKVIDLSYKLLNS